MEISTYFRMNEMEIKKFERTLTVVDERGSVR